MDTLQARRATSPDRRRLPFGHAFINLGAKAMAGPNPTNGISDASSRSSGLDPSKATDMRTAMLRDVDLSTLESESDSDSDTESNDSGCCGPSCGPEISSPGSSSCPASTDDGVSSCSADVASALIQASSASNRKDRPDADDDAVSTLDVRRQFGELIIDFSGNQAANTAVQ
jgi:hypothetical protein